MIKRCGMAGLVILVCLVQSAGAQEALPAKAEADVGEVLRQMGAGEEDIARFQLLSKVLGDDATPLLLLMMMRDGGGGGDDMLGGLLFMRALSGSSARQATAIDNGEELWVIEDGVAYRISKLKMEVVGSVAYRPSRKGGLSADLVPLLQQTREKALAASCLSNMKQLCLAASMYAQDWDGAMPAEDWANQLEPYCKTRAIYACPGAPDTELGFALNQALAGAKAGDVLRPSETVLFFETGLGEDVPFGGPDGVLMEPRHGGMVTVGFVDGHAKLMKPAEAQKLLEADPFR